MSSVVLKLGRERLRPSSLGLQPVIERVNFA